MRNEAEEINTKLWIRYSALDMKESEAEDEERVIGQV